ncbi:MAG: XRE family transcriptional regulator [Flavobacteriales bacterium]
MTLLNKIQSEFDDNIFDIEHESNMVQSRLLSPIIETIESQGITQEELAEKTGLAQPFISAVLNIRKNLNMEHIALFQKALGIILQPPTTLTGKEHKSKFYSKEEYDAPSDVLFESIYHTHPINALHHYSKNRNKVLYITSRGHNVSKPYSGKKISESSSYVIKKAQSI